MLNYEIWGNSVQTWIVSLLIIAGAFIVVKLLSLLGRKVIKPFIGRTNNRVDDIIYYSLESPLKFAVMLLGIWIAIHRLVYPDHLVKYVDNAYSILIILDITWVLARLSTALLQQYWGQRSDGHALKMMPVVRRTILVLIWIIGLVTALSNVGVDINALWGTLGIGGIAFALAAQDTVKNIFGAFTIFTDKPFGIGDTINVNGFEGTVVDVGMRSTRIMGYDRRITSYPNYKITDASIVNISSEPMRRAMVKVGLTYDTGADKMNEALDILRGLPAKVKDVSENPSDITAYFSDYTDSALVITFYYYIEKQGDILKVTSDMNLAILAAFNKAGLNFAFPTRTLLVQRGGEDARIPRRIRPRKRTANAQFIKYDHHGKYQKPPRTRPVGFIRQISAVLRPRPRTGVYAPTLRLYALGAHREQNPAQYLLLGRGRQSGGAVGNGALGRRNLAHCHRTRPEWLLLYLPDRKRGEMAGRNTRHLGEGGRHKRRPGGRDRLEPDQSGRLGIGSCARIENVFRHYSLRTAPPRFQHRPGIPESATRANFWP